MMKFDSVWKRGKRGNKKRRGLKMDEEEKGAK